MTLAVFLAIGESFADFAQKGQDKLLINQNLGYYSKSFDEVLVFSYGNERFSPYRNVKVLPNRLNVHRFIYSLLMLFFYKEEIKRCSVLRGLQLTGGIPAIGAKLLFKKHLVINYGYDYQRIARKEGRIWQAWLYTFLQPIILNLSSAIIVTTKELKEKLKGKWPHKLFLIPNGVDTSKFKPLKKIKKSKIIIYVGRFDPVKNLLSLVQAMALLPKGFKLMLIGSGSLKEKIATEAQRLTVNLQIIESVPHDKLPKYLHQASIFVLPSLEEGHPKALLEAMACGLPVIGTNVPGIKKLIQHKKNGLICTTAPEGIAKAIKKIFDNPRLAKRLGNNAHKFVKKNFDLSKTFTMEVDLLKQLGEQDKIL